eukprot:514115-Rhodomonas_salina.1
MQHARVPALGQPADSSPHTRTHGCRTPCLDRALSFFLCAGWQALCDADVGCALLPGRSPRSRRLPRATRTSSRSASPALRYLEPKVDLCLPWRLSPACLDADVLPPVLKIPAFPAFSACPDFCVQRAYVHVRVRACTVHRVTCKLTRTPRCQVRCTLGEMSEVMAEIFGCALLLPPPLSPFASSALFLSNARRHKSSTSVVGGAYASEFGEKDEILKTRAAVEEVRPACFCLRYAPQTTEHKCSGLSQRPDGCTHVSCRWADRLRSRATAVCEGGWQAPAHPRRQDGPGRP